MPSVGVPLDQLLIELSSRSHGLATPALVAQSGLTSNQWNRLVQHDVWIPVVPGLWRHCATPLTWTMQVHAGSRWLGREAALYGTTAATWLGLEGCEATTAAFLVPRGRRYLPPWLELHTTSEWTLGDTVRRDGIRTSTATRAIIDMAAVASLRQLESAIDSAIRMRLTSVPTLARRIGELGGSGRAGIRNLRTLLLDSGGESRLERRFLRLMRIEHLPRPTSQVVHHANGRTIRVDFEFPGRDLVVEVTGKLGHSTDRDRQRDARRRNHLQRMGRTVLEFTAADVFADPQYVVTTVRDHVRVMSPPKIRR